MSPLSESLDNIYLIINTQSILLWLGILLISFRELEPEDLGHYTDTVLLVVEVPLQ